MRRAVGLALGIAACSGGQVARDPTASGAEPTASPPRSSAEPGATARVDHGALPLGEPPLRFAVIGDFGLDGDDEAEVAALVAGWDPALILTVGDNNYHDGDERTIDVNIGKHYHQFIAPYTGRFGAGAAENRFFPCPGNHDWRSGDLQPYLDYFTLPGNERYYRLRRGPRRVLPARQRRARARWRDPGQRPGPVARGRARRLGGELPGGAHASRALLLGRTPRGDDDALALRGLGRGPRDRRP